jgi:hypothetical protein
VKNLVLGGIAAFTLVDKALVTPRDLGRGAYTRPLFSST